LLGAGCATVPTRTSPTEPATKVDFPAVTVQGDARLAAMNDEELFAEGNASFGAKDYGHAAVLFGRIVDAFPHSPHFAQAALQAGQSHEQLGDWTKARERFAAISDPAHGQGPALDAAFHLAEADYHLSNYGEAAVLLETLADRADLPLAQRVQARVQQGICQVESGESDQAETTLRRAIADWHGAPHPEDVDSYFPAQAEFFLGEIYRQHEEDVALDPDQTAEELGKQLEYKAELLLSAQGHYLRSIRVGNDYWATAAGAQVASLYEGLYHYLQTAPTPTELDAAETDVYRQEVQKKIRVLLTKAISIYESTIDAADRLGTRGPFVEKARAELERLKNLLVSEDATAAEGGTGPASRSPSDAASATDATTTGGATKKTPPPRPASLRPQSLREHAPRSAARG
jgi:tetratricopeptide (TPR) repeat protein